MFTKSDLSALVDAKATPAVSIFMPTHVMGRETRQDPVRLKNLLGQARDKLQSAGQTPAQAEALLLPAAQLVDDYDFWQHQEHGLALFLGAGDMRSHKVPAMLEERVVVGDRFNVRPLLPLLAADGSFLVLTITANEVHLFRASRFALTEEDSSGLPTSLDQVKGEADYENPQMAQPIGRPSVGSLDVSKAQVQGASPEDWRKERLVEYIRRIAQALRDRLASEPMPVVVAADAETGGHFRKVGTLGPLLAGTVETNPDTLDASQLHAAAYDMVRPLLENSRKEAQERFAAALGRGEERAARMIEDVAKAAYEGRVEVLFVAEGASVHRRFDEASSQLLKTNDEPGDAQDLLDALTARTLGSGGAVYVLPSPEMPEGLPAAALLRY
jgi:hypothetical protein